MTLTRDMLILAAMVFCLILRLPAALRARSKNSVLRSERRFLLRTSAMSASVRMPYCAPTLVKRSLYAHFRIRSTSSSTSASLERIKD